MATVRVENLVKRFGAVTALKSVSVEIPDGSLTAILGPSGCGKTTLLRCISGLLLADQGRIVIGDRDMTRIEPFRRNLGMVFQRPSMFPHLTVYQNIAWALRLRRWRKQDIPARVDEMLRLVRLQGMATRTYAQLSGGQAQRVVIARALAPQPDLLLLDEPLSALDAQLRSELLAEIADIQRQVRCTTLLVTHDQSEALTAADNLLLMHEGEIVQQGRPLDVYRYPQDLFSANFIGTNNLLPCTITAVQGATAALRLEGSSIALSAPVGKTQFQVGQSVWACIRADDVDVIASDEALDGDPNIVTVQVAHAALTGSFVRVEGCIDQFPVRIHVGGSRRFVLLEGAQPQLRCVLGHITIVERKT